MGVTEDQSALSERLDRIAALIREGALDEAETEALRALSDAPRDARALKTLAFVRFKLGRFAQAREVYRTLVLQAPEDTSARVNLGLIALKLDWVDEAIAELEAARTQRPDDAALSRYLGYAYARSGRTEQAAQEFLRAGEPDLARRVETGEEHAAPEAERPAETSDPHLHQRRPPSRPSSSLSPTPLSAPSSGFAIPPGSRPRTGSQAGGERPSGGFGEAGGSTGRGSRGGREGTGRTGATALSTFVLARLVPSLKESQLVQSAAASGGARTSMAQDDALVVAGRSGAFVRLPVEGSAVVVGSALIAAEGALTLTPAPERVRGRSATQNLDPHPDPDVAPFISCEGQGLVWISGVLSADLSVVRLDDDVVYVRRERLLGFSAGVLSEAGRLPGTAVELVQLLGAGLVVLDADPKRIVTMRLPQDPNESLLVEVGRLVGWVGRVVVRPQVPSVVAGGSSLAIVCCEGEGVVLLSSVSLSKG